MTNYYQGIHVDQFNGSTYQSYNCVPTCGANGARVVTKGRLNLSGAQVRKKVARWEEQNPANPGWSLDDLDLAMARLGVGFSIHSRATFTDILWWSDRGFAVAMQGLSSVFTEGCSAKFNGGHCILLHPQKHPNDDTLRLIGDGICTSWRFERETRLQQYVERLYGKNHIRYGVYTTPVPILGLPDTDTEEDIEVHDEVEKAEDWKAIGGNGVLRTRPDRSLTPFTKLPDGTKVRSTFEFKSKDGNNWRATKWQGKTAFMLVTTPRTDWQPLVQGGDPSVNAEYTTFINNAGH